MHLYHAPSPIGGWTIGYIAAAAAFLMWMAVYFYFFVFFKRKERQAAQLKQQLRLQPPQPRDPAAKRRDAALRKAAKSGTGKAA